MSVSLFSAGCNNAQRQPTHPPTSHLPHPHAPSEVASRDPIVSSLQTPTTTRSGARDEALDATRSVATMGRGGARAICRDRGLVPLRGCKHNLMSSARPRPRHAAGRWPTAAGGSRWRSIVAKAGEPESVRREGRGRDGGAPPPPAAAPPPVAAPGAVFGGGRAAPVAVPPSSSATFGGGGGRRRRVVACSSAGRRGRRGRGRGGVCGGAEGASTVNQAKTKGASTTEGKQKRARRILRTPPRTPRMACTNSQMACANVLFGVRDQDVHLQVQSPELCPSPRLASGVRRAASR